MSGSAALPGAYGGSTRWEIRLAERELRASGAPVPLGSRAFDILEALVLAAGRVVTKEELFQRVWGRAIVEDNTLQVHVSAVRRALGEDRRWLKTVPGRGYRLLGTWTIAGADGSAHPAGTAAARSIAPLPEPGNLPSAGIALVGRDLAIEQAQDFATAYRVVTFVGPGGIGKTRLALEVARRLAPRFRNDVWLVELAALADPALVCSTVAQTLHLDLDGSDPSCDNVAQAIGNRNLLLILDNCEHVIDAAAVLAEAIVVKCPHASILTTSREPLEIDGEHVFRVLALDVPSSPLRDSTDALQHSAVALFVAKMQEQQAGFVPDPDGLAGISTICRRLDGIPLALELAAARATMLGLRNVVSRLDGRFGLLVDGRRTALPRHQTLQATFDWSWQLLSDTERGLLQWMAVFPGGFTLEAATAIMGRSGVAPSDVVNDVGNLVAKSLLYLVDGPVVRWRMLETTRAYAIERLKENGEARTAALRHAEHVRDLLEPSEQVADDEASGRELERKGGEIDNVRVALDWCFSDAGDRAIGVQLTAAYVPVWLYRSLMAECRTRIERALEHVREGQVLSPHLAMKLHVSLAIAVTHTTGLVERSRAALARALEIAETLGDVDARLRSLWALWDYHSNSREYETALRMAELFFQLAGQSANPASGVVANRLMGHSLHYRGSQADARRYCERVLEIEAADGRPRTIWFQYDQGILAGAILARVLWLTGFPDQAAAMAEVQCRAAAGSDHTLSLCYVLCIAAIPIAAMSGDLAGAEQSLAMCIDTAVRERLYFYRNWARCLEGALLVSRGEHAAALSILRDALTGLGTVGRRHPMFQIALAEGLAGTGQIPEALTVMGEALAHANDGGDYWCVPELQRVTGELLLRQGGSDARGTAERHFLQALDMARRHGALSWELRIALSLARLKPRLGLRDESYLRLAAVYDRFTEGFGTADMLSARKLLQQALHDRP